MHRRFRLIVAVLLMLCLVQIKVRAAGEVPDSPENKKWNVEGNTATIVVDSRTDILPILLDKTALSGRVITIQSDAKYVSLTTASLPKTHVTLTVAKDDQNKPDTGDGSTSTLKFVTGGSPTFAFNGKNAGVKDSILWSNIAKSTDTTVTLEILDATFAKITFEAPPAPPVAGSHLNVPPTTRPVQVATTELLHTVPAVKLQAAVNKFSDSVSKKCLNCGGTGKVQVQVQVGTRQQGLFVSPVMEQQTQDCPRCKGKGNVRESDRVIQTNAEDVLKKLINLDVNDKKSQDVLKTAYSKLTDSIVGNQQTWDYFTHDAKSTMSVPNPNPGTLVIAEVWIDKSERDAKGRRLYHAEIAGTTNKFLVINPPAADNVNDGFALMGGLIAPASEKPDANSPTVLQGAFIIAPDIDDKWIWWIRHHKD